jgi:antitoxin component YwqK of YwqJK toxin-antitoxin module
MIRLKLQIFFLFLASLSIAQTKIHLKAPKYLNEFNDFYGDFQFVNIKDTTYIKVGHQEDMGAQYMHYYELKNKAPDGEYLIFVDDTMRLRAFMKDFNKDSTWTSYFGNGKPALTVPYKKGKINGERIEYYKSGAIQSKVKFKNDKPIGIVTTFYESGKIERKCYYDNDVKVKEEVFDENGKIIRVYGSQATETKRKK